MLPNIDFTRFLNLAVKLKDFKKNALLISLS